MIADGGVPIGHPESSIIKEPENDVSALLMFSRVAIARLLSGNKRRSKKRMPSSVIMPL